MTLNFTLFTLAEPTQPILELSTTVQQQLWQNSQSYATASSRYQAYLNQLCLETVLPWLQSELTDRVQPWPNRAVLPSFWELLNGTALTVGSTRLLCIPSEAIDLSELRVPQEWVDCPSWIADYYLAVQIEPDQGWVRIWGYCTHQMLKNQGSYDASDRTYSLDEAQLITDITVFKVAQQVSSHEPTRTTLPALASLSQPQAENLLQRLSNSAMLTPRLEIPFSLWGALIDHGGWRQRLCSLRSGQAEQGLILQWLEQGISQLGQQLGWQRLAWDAAISSARSTAPAATPSAIARPLTIESQPYTLKILRLVQQETSTWRFELSTATPGVQIPQGFTLRLLTEDLQPFAHNEDTATTSVDSLWVEVVLVQGEGLVWEITPTPDAYDREILRF